MCITKIGRLELYQSEVLLQFDNLVHGFTTRKGGVSSGEYASMSLSPYRGDDINCVHKNEEILMRELSLDLGKLSSTKQEHTENIGFIDENNIGIGIRYEWERPVDACITTLKNVPLICYSADCVPILLFARDIGAIAAIHSGWKGTKKHIAEKCLEELLGLGADEKNIYGAIGPCIGQCCYEVSGDVANEFDIRYSVPKKAGKYMLDLGKVNFDMLTEKGVPGENISVSPYCTSCNNELFFSHRRQNGKSGTLGGIICMK